ALSEGRINPGVDNFYNTFHQRLIAGTIGPGGDYGCTVVFCKISKRLVNLGLIFTALSYCTLQVVRNNGGRNASKILKCTFGDVDQIFRLLRVHGLNIGELATAQDGGKYFYFLFFTRVWINNRKLVSGKINVGLVACFMLQVHHGVTSPYVLMKVKTKLTSAIAFRIVLVILFPKLLKSHTFSLELFTQFGE